MKRGLWATLALLSFLLISPQLANAASFSQPVGLAPGWNIVSTPRVVESHTFSAPETLDNFSIFVLDASRPSGWATMGELGQSEFTPLYGYFIYNHTTSTQTLTFNYKASTTPAERLFSRTFSTPGWYSIGVANPSYAAQQGEPTTTPTNAANTLSTFAGATAFVVDFTDANSNVNTTALIDPWKAVATSDLGDLKPFRETKGYAVYVSSAPTTYAGFQLDTVPHCSDGLDNDSDGNADFPYDLGCFGPSDSNEVDPPHGTLTVSKDTTYANQTVGVPQTAMKIGEFQVEADGEDILLLGLIAGFDGSISSSTISDVYLTYSTSTTTVIPNGGAVMGWDINEVISDGASLTIRAYANIPGPLPDGATTTIALGGVGVGLSSGVVILGLPVEGQVITVGSGTFTSAVDAATPPMALLVGGSQPKVASFKFTATNESFTITELYASTTATGHQVIGNFIWKDGASTIATTPFNGPYSTTTGLSVLIPANSTKTLDAYLQLGAVGTPGDSPTGLNVQIGLDGFKYQNSVGAQSMDSTDRIGNPMYVYKTKPTISNVALPSTVPVVGYQSVAKFTISSDASGTIAWRRIRLSVASSSSGVFYVTNYTIYDIANEATSLANVTVSNSGVPTSTITFLSSTDQEVSGSKTYVVKANISGTIPAGSLLSHNFGYGQFNQYLPASFSSVTGGASFVWSDESVVPHEEDSPSWSGDYLVKNIPTDSQTLAK